MFKEINFDEYLSRKDTNVVELSMNPLYFSVFLAFRRAHEGWFNTSPFSLILTEIEKRARNGSDVFINGYRINFESFRQNPKFSAKKFKLKNIFDVAFLHFVRNVMINHEMTYSDIEANLNTFEKVADYKNKFHKKNTAEFWGNENNVKWVTSDGGSEEYIFKPTEQGWQLVLDPINQGSYNFASSEDILAHTELDVIPWTIFGNFITDPTTEAERLPKELTDHFDQGDLKGLYKMVLVLSIVRSMAIT